MILKRLANTRARAGQMKEYVRHLKRTYADRVQYWQARSTSRLFFLPCGRRSFCMITDGMDRSKFKLPRSRIMTTKEFDSFSRPSLDMSAMITHGHSCVIAISGPRVGKGSSWVVDLFANALHRLADQHDIRSAEVILQSDNCSKETKNNCMMHFMGMITSLKKVYRTEMRYLQTAHTHEDVDQYFSAIATHIQASPELHTPADFVWSLTNFGRDHPDVRPYEPNTIVYEVGGTRDWSFVAKDQERLKGHENHSL